MKLVYTHENKIIVENVRCLLSAEGIESFLRNEFSGGGAGELSPLTTWPELWVEEAYLSKAKAVIEQMRSTSLGTTWRCNHCGEENESSFEICWNCQSESD